jgi:hypothetical protein
MTIESYRLSVLLRWGDLESLKVKDIPLKIHLQSLRKRSEWPTCSVYDCSECKQNCECIVKGSENFLRCTQRKTNPCDCEDDEVELIVLRKNKGWKRDRSWYTSEEAFLEDAEKSESGPCGQPGGPLFCWDVEDVSDGLQPSEVENEEPLQSQGGEHFVNDNSFVRSFYVEPEFTRGRKRAIRNNERVNFRLDPLVARLIELKSKREWMPGERRAGLESRISSTRQSIRKLKSQLLELASPTRREKGGTQIPPYPDTGPGMDPDPFVRNFISNGERYYGCSSCEFPLDLSRGACPNRTCLFFGRKCKAVFTRVVRGRRIVIRDWFTSRAKYGK